MKKFIMIAVAALALTGCAKTYEQGQLEQQLMQAGHTDIKTEIVTVDTPICTPVDRYTVYLYRSNQGAGIACYVNGRTIIQSSGFQ